MLGWFSYRYLPWQIWNADFRTATGETREVTLADNSQVLLNTASAISVRFDSEARRIQHLQVRFWWRPHTSEYKTLPFIVQTADGRLQALGTRFIVRKHARSTTLSVLQGAVQVMPSHSTQTLVVQAGEQVSFDAPQGRHRHPAAIPCRCLDSRRPVCAQHAPGRLPGGVAALSRRGPARDPGVLPNCASPAYSSCATRTAF
jgi:ferric-dicitrate binding protein FerR (iron transport regulator)